jgi:hypothetical protein
MYFNISLLLNTVLKLDSHLWCHKSVTFSNSFRKSWFSENYPKFKNETYMLLSWLFQRLKQAQNHILNLYRAFVDKPPPLPMQSVQLLYAIEKS